MKHDFQFSINFQKGRKVKPMDKSHACLMTLIPLSDDLLTKKRNKGEIKGPTYLCRRLISQQKVILIVFFFFLNLTIYRINNGTRISES